LSNCKTTGKKMMVLMRELSDIKGCVFNIQRMAVDDGPGIRTVVFLKGCKMYCFWCHNPESWKDSPEIQYYPERCIGCRACEYVCPKNLHRFENDTHKFIREECTACGTCVDACPADSLVLAGEMMTVDEVVKEAKRDLPFFKRTNGGVTISGGEPLNQPDFTFSLLKRLKEDGVNTAVESSFCVEWDIIERIIKYVDYFLIDIKIGNSNKHRKIIGIPNELIINNIKLLDETGAKYCIRTPIIPGVNDNKDSMSEICDIVKQLKNIEYIELMPYHSMGENKYTSLGLERKFIGMKAPEKEQLDTLAHEFSKHGIKVKYK
jgi:pyruvate formate lyase activating enzyme